MNWFWLRAATGGYPRRAACRMAVQDGWPGGRWPGGSCAPGSAWWSRAAAGCTGSPGSTGRAGATVFISTAAPDAPVGRQLTWFLRAVADIPWSQRLIQAHFDSGFLAQISPAEINSVLAQTPAPGGASLIGLLWQDPARDPVSLQAVAAFGSVMLTVNITVDGAGLISYLLLTLYQPPPATWAQADRDLAGLAPDASLLAARISPGGVCTPIHQVAASAARPLASMFKLFVLGALAQQVAAGRVSWNQELTVTDAVKSAGNSAGMPAGRSGRNPDAGASRRQPR